MFKKQKIFKIRSIPFSIFVLCTLFSNHIRVYAQSKLVAENAKLESIGGSYSFTEGPASDAKGNVFFTDIPKDEIYMYTSTGVLQLFSSNVPGNGLAFDINEKLIVCGHNGSRNLYYLEIPSAKKTIIIDNINGKKFNSPNDLWIDKNNGIYFTDPRYGNRDNMELETEQVYYLKPDHKTVIQVTEKLQKPNGVYGFDNGKKLLVADSEAKIVYVYNVKKDGTLSGRKKFIENEGVDGMTMDELGNIYVASGNVKIYDQKGFLIDEIKTPHYPTNVCFGGSEMKTLFITERKQVYKLEMNVKGMRY